jgi:AcrR family transcriptional regulator
LSTNVDHRRRARRAPRSTASETRAKIARAARVAFSQAGFDQLGVREIAASAGVDPAVVMRLFGSKEALFAAVAEGAFALDAPFEGPAAGLGLRVAKHLTGTKGETGPEEFDEFAFLMRSAASPTAAPLLSKALHAGFVAPLAKHLGGKDAPMRAALLTACVLGYATLRFALGSSALEEAARARLTERLGEALQTLATP